MPSRAPHPEQPLGGPVEQRDRLGRADPDHGVAQRGEDPDGARLGGPLVTACSRATRSDPTC